MQGLREARGDNLIRAPTDSYGAPDGIHRKILRCNTVMAVDKHYMWC